MFKYKIIPFKFLLIVSLLFSCSKKEENIVVVVVDQQLTKEEFVNRYKTTKDFQNKSTFTVEQIRNFINENAVSDLLISAEAFRTDFDKRPEILEKLDQERKHVLVRANGPLFNVIIKDYLTISEQELKDLYEQIDDQLRINQIIISSKELADSLYNVLQTGADFAQIASKYSIDISSKDRGGAVNQLFTKGSVSANFDDVAFDLNLNEISKPIKTSYGYQIVKIIGKHKAKKQTFEEMKSTLERRLRSKKITDFTINYYDQLFEKYKFSVDQAAAKNVIAAYAKPKTDNRELQIPFDVLSEKELENPVILYTGGNWTVKEFIEKYNNSSYINHIPLRRIDDVLNFGRREGIKDMMYLEAIDLKLDEKPEFIKNLELRKKQVIIREYRNEIAKDISEPSEEEVKKFYEENNQNFQGIPLDQVRNQITHQLKNYKADQKISNEIIKLRQQYKVEIDNNVIVIIVNELNELKKQSVLKK